MKLINAFTFLLFFSLNCNPKLQNEIPLGKGFSYQGEKMKGLSFVAPPRPFSNNPMEAVQQSGANWIAVIPYAYTRQGEANVHYNTSNWQWWGERPEGVCKSIELANKDQIKVMLKPQVYIPGSWTGNLDYGTTEEWVEWEAAYEAYVMPYVEKADSLGVSVFCIGTEFSHSVVKREIFWRKLIKKIRTKFKGQLVYAANWDDYKEVPFWDDLDYVGIDAYFPLVDKKTPSVKELVKAWQPIKKDIKRYAHQMQKPILFTEYGYLSVDGCAYNTWELEARVKKLAINEQAQANALEAMFEVFWNEPYWAGGYLWKWFPNGKGHEGYIERDYTPQGKKGEKVLEQWYKKE